jgi:hypothetical protein
MKIYLLYCTAPTALWIMLQSLPLSPSRDTSPVRFGGRFLDDDMLTFGEHNNLGSYFGGPSNDLRRDDFQEGKHHSFMDHKRISDSTKSHVDIHHNDQRENRRTSFPAESPGYNNYLRVWQNYTHIFTEN